MDIPQVTAEVVHTTERPATRGIGTNVKVGLRVERFVGSIFVLTVLSLSDSGSTDL